MDLGLANLGFVSFGFGMWVIKAQLLQACMEYPLQLNPVSYAYGGLGDCYDQEPSAQQECLSRGDLCEKHRECNFFRKKCRSRTKARFFKFRAFPKIRPKHAVEKKYVA